MLELKVGLEFVVLVGLVVGLGFLHLLLLVLGFLVRRLRGLLRRIVRCRLLILALR